MSDAPPNPIEFVAPSVEELAPLFPAYQIEVFIAQGGMGAVYRATQRSLDRPVAIKILPPELGEDKAYLASFESEAKSLAKLNHSNLVGIFDFGVVNDMYYIIMEYVPGRSLYYTSNGHAVDELEAAFLISEICKGLAHAHEHGILHRDIKPANILIDDEARPMLVDFGLAKPVNDQNHHGVIFGTPGYTAPEVVSNPMYVDHKADIFSVGVMLYELLTAELPEEPGKPFIPASQKNDTDPRFDLIIARAMHPMPHMRYNNCTEMARDLDQLVVDWDIHSDPRQGSGTKILATAASAGAATGEMMLYASQQQLMDPNQIFMSMDPNIQAQYAAIAQQAMAGQQMMQMQPQYIATGPIYATAPMQSPLSPRPTMPMNTAQALKATPAPTMQMAARSNPEASQTFSYKPKTSSKSGLPLAIMICFVVVAAVILLFIMARNASDRNATQRVDDERAQYIADKKTEAEQAKAAAEERKRRRREAEAARNK